MALNLAKAVIGYLKERPEEKFTARQIAEWVFATYPDECQEKRANRADMNAPFGGKAKSFSQRQNLMLLRNQ